MRAKSRRSSWKLKAIVEAISYHIFIQVEWSFGVTWLKSIIIQPFIARFEEPHLELKKRHTVNLFVSV